MTLLHIAEPGMAAVPHQRRLVAGIDLGTTNSLVATVQSGIASVLPDLQGRALLPSAVRYFTPERIDVGYDALACAHDDPANSLVSVKRFMGRALRDIGYAQALPYRFVDTPGMLSIETTAGLKNPMEISAEILKALRRRAEEALGGDLTGVVITVPAYFDDAQRQATRDAARLAGLHVLRLLNEPTAAAIAYGLDNAGEGLCVVYDLGGGTFDVSILRLCRGVFEVLATGGDSALGGDDFDRRVYDWILKKQQLSTPSLQDAHGLLSLAREAKQALTHQFEVSIRACLETTTLPEIVLTQAEFWELTQDLVDKTLKSTRGALRDAGLSAADIQNVVLVGGATRMPHVRAAVTDLFRKPPLTDLDPDQAVALGAAIQANVLAGNSANDMLLLDVIPLSLGIETMGGLVEKIISRNSTVPVACAQEFTTFKDGQTAMSIHVVQGERELASECRSLAHFELREIPPMVAGAARIRVTFEVDADGLLSVSARETSTGVHTSVLVKPSYGLTDEAITRLLLESQIHASEDAQARTRREQYVDAQRLLDATEAALAQDGEALLSGIERLDIETAVHVLREALREGTHTAIAYAMNSLNEMTTEFAARRMNRNIQAALTGRQIAELR